MNPIGTDNEPARSELLRNGTTTGTEIRGKVLEAQVQVPGAWLLFVTDGCPFEEILHLILLGRDLKILDKMRIGRPYQGGVFSNLRIVDGDTVEFEFPASRLWRARILASKKWMRSEFPFLPRRSYIELRQVDMAVARKLRA